MVTGYEQYGASGGRRQQQYGPSLTGPNLLQQAPQQSNFLGGKLTIPSTEMGSAMAWQGGLQAGQLATNGMVSGFNYGLASQHASGQEAVAKKYYAAQETIAGLKHAVAMRQLDVQETGMYIQQQMHQTQVSHEQRMMKLEGSTQARLVQIQESGKTSRAKQIATTDAFSARRSWSYGSPLNDSWL